MSTPLSYYVALGGESQGPFTLSQLRELWKSGRVTMATQFWSDDGFPDWRPLSEILDIIEPPTHNPAVQAAATARAASRDPEVDAGTSILICIASAFLTPLAFLLGIILYIVGRKKLGGRLIVWSLLWVLIGGIGVLIIRSLAGL